MLVVIPARGGSRRLPRKNIAMVCGRPLIAYTIDAALTAGVSPHVVVSTEDAEIAAVAMRAGVRVINRPVELATDSASTESVLLHALSVLEGEGQRFDWVMTLPPTSPLRSAATIHRFAEEINRDPASQDCLMSVHENRGDFWTRQADGSVRRLFPNAPRRQQDREPLLEENSAIYVSRVSSLHTTGSVLGKRVRALIIDAVEGLDINTAFDLAIVDAWLRQKSRNEIPPGGSS